MKQDPEDAALWVPGPLPGLNELLAAAGGSGGRRAGYARLKRDWTEAVWAHAKSVRMPAFPGPVLLDFTWVERDRRRDPDNVAAGGRKLCMDGLVKARVLKGDGWKIVRGWMDRFDVNPARPGVQIRVRRFASGFELIGRLPG